MWGSIFGYSSLALFVAVRLGMFGTKTITIDPESDYYSIHNYILVDKARWIPTDIRTMVHEFSIRPIEFVFVKGEKYD